MARPCLISVDSSHSVSKSDVTVTTCKGKMFSRNRSNIWPGNFLDAPRKVFVALTAVLPGGRLAHGWFPVWGHYWLNRKNCCVPEIGLVTVFAR